MSNITVQPEFNQEQLSLIKATVAKGATDDELKLFLYRCKNMGLDPLKPGLVHFVKYGSNPGSVIVGIDGIRARAHKTGKISGIKRGVLKDESGKLVGGWCEVYRSDWQHPAREEVSLAEYDTGKAQWATKKETMIKKVAEVAALRMACPEELGGIYAEEEMTVNAEVRDVKAKELTQQIQQTEETPEFEDAPFFEDPPFEQGMESTPGDFIFSVGKQHKGKALKNIPKAKLEEFVNWVDEQGDQTHPDVAECKARVVEYLILEAEK